jgi:hypothetical protein
MFLHVPPASQGPGVRGNLIIVIPSIVFQELSRDISCKFWFHWILNEHNSRLNRVIGHLEISHCNSNI